MTYTLQIEYGDDVLLSAGMSRDAFQREARFLLAATLYERGRVSSGQAAGLCGMEHEDFLKVLDEGGRDANVPVVREAAATYGQEMTERDMRVAACVIWYELGRLSQGRASEFAGLSREEFLDELASYGVSPIQVEPEELAAELGE